MRVSHGACGKSWVQRGNRTSHCSQCHETFEGITLFDRHQVRRDGVIVCLDPQALDGARLVGDTWRGPKMPEGVFG